VAALVADHPGLADALGDTPSHWAGYRFADKLAKERSALKACLDALAASLRKHYADMGVEVAIDASDLPANANGQRCLYNHGPEQHRHSDPDASWGHRSAISTRKGGGFYGHKLHMAACAQTGRPLAWRVETARTNESMFVADLLDAVKQRGYEPVTVAMDKGTTTTASTPSAPTATANPSSRSARAASTPAARSRATRTSGSASTVAVAQSSASSAA
jgi:hypothetical protein